MRALPLIVPVLALALTGCGIPSPQAANPAAPQNPGQQPLPAQATSTVAPTELPVLAARTTTDNRTPVLVQLRQLKVTGATMTLNFTVTNRSPNGDSWAINGYFDDGITQNNEEGANSVDGVAVIDTAGAKRYLPARGGDHRCICSTGLLYDMIGQDQTMYLSATYQAVPAEVAKVTIDIPHVGAFTDIPVTR